MAKNIFPTENIGDSVFLSGTLPSGSNILGSVHTISTVVGAGNLILVQSQAVSGVTSVDFNSLSGTRFLLTIRAKNITATSVWSMRVNDDTSANYITRFISNVTSSQITGATSGKLIDHTGIGLTQSYTSGFVFITLSSDGTTKRITWDGLTGNESEVANRFHGQLDVDKTDVTDVTVLANVASTISGEFTLYELTEA